MPEKSKFPLGTQRTLEAIIANPGKTDKEIAKILGWTVLTVRSNTAVLESGRAISVDMRGLTDVYYPRKEEPAAGSIFAARSTVPVAVAGTVPVAGSLSNILTEVLKKNGVQTSQELL
jgi:hypothetical protein